MVLVTQMRDDDREVDSLLWTWAIYIVEVMMMRRATVVPNRTRPPVLRLCLSLGHNVARPHRAGRSCYWLCFVMMRIAGALNA